MRSGSRWWTGRSDKAADGEWRCQTRHPGEGRDLRTRSRGRMCRASPCACHSRRHLSPAEIPAFAGMTALDGSSWGPPEKNHAPRIFFESCGNPPAGASLCCSDSDLLPPRSRYPEHEPGRANLPPPVAPPGSTFSATGRSTKSPAILARALPRSAPAVCMRPAAGREGRTAGQIACPARARRDGRGTTAASRAFTLHRLRRQFPPRSFLGDAR